MSDIDEDISRYLNYRNAGGILYLDTIKHEVKNDKLIDVMMSRGKEISYRTNNFEKNNMDSIDKMFNKKVIFVVDGKKIENKNGKKNKNNVKDKLNFEENVDIQNLKELGSQGRLSLYFTVENDENLTSAEELIKLIFGHGVEATKTMISLKKTFTSNDFTKLFNKNFGTKAFNIGYTNGYRYLFNELSPQAVAVGFRELLTGNIKEENINKYVDSIKYYPFFTEELKKEIESLLKNDDNTINKTVVLKQLVIGSLFSYIEQNFETFFYDNNKYNRNININKINLNIKNQLIYRILCLLTEGYSVQNIAKKLNDILEEEKTKTNKETLEDRVNDVITSIGYHKISTIMKKSDITVSKIREDNDTEKEQMKKVKDFCEEIIVLFEDSVLPTLDEQELINKFDMQETMKQILKQS
jgi:hypothetical protein